MNGLVQVLLLIVSFTLELVVSVPADVTEEHTAPCSVRFSEHATGQGFFNRTFNDVPYCAFLGIRYAKPPVGELRFANPVQQDPEGHENYTSYGSVCSQYKNINRQDAIVGNEDCLYLNVFSPVHEARSDSDVHPVKYPVLVFIHGGSFVAGSGEVHGVDLLMENELIVITLNYRLGVFGFLRYDRQNITGNYGLRDQLAALQWIRRNVHHFGGDPERVTLMGHSAGGASVTHQLYHEQARGLFHSLIVLSGSMLGPWAILYDYTRCLDNYIQDLGASTLDELRELDFQRFFIRDFKFRHTFAFSSMFYVCFIPTLDNNIAEHGTTYFPSPPHKMVQVKTPPQMPILISETTTEFELLLPHVFDFWMSTNYLNRHHPTIRQQIGDILDKVGKWAVARELEPTKKQFYQKMANMANIFYPIRRLMNELGRRMDKDQLYYLRFEFDGKFGEYKKKLYAKQLETQKYGALHGDELGYIFSPYNLREALANRTEYRKELSVHIRTVELIANFVKYGNPTPKRSKLSDVIWTTYNEADNRTNYLNIDEEFTMRQTDDQRNLYTLIWHSVYECLYHSQCETISKLELLAEQYGGMIVELNNDEYFELLTEDIKNNMT